MVHPHTITVYHAGPEPTGEEIARAKLLFRQGNGSFVYSFCELVDGSTRPIKHTPPGYEGIPVAYQTDLELKQS